MTACEPCWNEAYRQSQVLGGSQVDHYLRLLDLLDGHPHIEAPDPIPPTAARQEGNPMNERLMHTVLNHIESIHQDDGDGYCIHDGFNYPCPTADALTCSCGHQMADHPDCGCEAPCSPTAARQEGNPMTSSPSARDMTVAELRERLAEYPDWWPVVPFVNGTAGICTATYVGTLNDEGNVVFVGEVDIPPHLQESVIEFNRAAARQEATEA